MEESEREEHIKNTESFLNLLSNKRKSERELYVVETFLEVIGEKFDEIDRPKKSLTDPPDVTFKSAHFEIKEMMDAGRKRGKEVQDRLKDLKSGGHIETQFAAGALPVCPSTLVNDIANYMNSLGAYSPDSKAELDLLLYYNSLSVWLSAKANPDYESTALLALGWRSISLTSGRTAMVYCAQTSAPTFLRERVGQTFTWKLK